MLLSFSVENFLSIADEQKLSLVSDFGKELPSNAFEYNDKLKLLKSCVLYGANASGKSNFLKALLVMTTIITSSNSIDYPLPVKPFLFEKEKRHEPSLFEINVVIDGDRYQYGFSCTKERIVSEWLYVHPNISGRKRVFFERVFDDENNCYEWNITNNIKGARAVWQQTTRDKVLFLTNSVALNCTTLKPLYDFFSKQLKIVFDTDLISPDYTADLIFNNQKEIVLKFLSAADLKIRDLNVKKEPIDLKKIKGVVSESIRNKIEKNSGSLYRLDVKTVHLDDQDQPIELDLYSEESEGTKRLFAFAGPFIDVLKNGKVLVVDELNISLHPKLMEFLVNLFHSAKTNPKNAQLIFTTHETSILTQDIFRRDQIWFTKRNDKQQTILFPLTDFKPLKGSGKEKIDVNYLRGKYGALPHVDSYSLEDPLYNSITET